MLLLVAFYACIGGFWLGFIIGHHCEADHHCVSELDKP